MLNVVYFYGSTFQSVCAVRVVVITTTTTTSLDASKLECIQQKFVYLSSFFSHIDYSYGNVLNSIKLHTLSAYFNRFYYGLKYFLTLIETAGLCVPDQNFRDFALFNVDFKC
jgi:hypothetical protein